MSVKYWIIFCSILVLLPVAVGFNTWEAYWTSYVSEPYYPRLYACGSTYGDVERSDTGDGVDANIQFSIPYAGKHFSCAFVASDGHVELNEESPCVYSYKLLTTSWPNMLYPDQFDPPFISPFIADWYFQSTSDRARLYWQRLDPTETSDPDDLEIIHNLLSHMSQEARDHVVGAESFEALYGLIVTWNDVKWSSCNTGACARNTIQMVLLTDERSSHVIYNFYNVTWVGGSEQQCQGMPTEGDNCVPAQVGFNAGWGRHFTELPGSKTGDVVNIDDKGSTGVQGRYVYQTHETYPV